MTTNRFVLRRATNVDSDALSQLSQQTWRETHLEDLAMSIPKHDVEFYLRTQKSPEWYASKIADPFEATWLIEDKISNEIVAYLIVGRCEVPHPDFCLNKDGQIEFLYVRRDRQSQGIGKQLMNVALSWMKEQFPERPIWLTTLACNFKSQKLYMSYGFTIVGDFYSNVGDTQRHLIIMRRENSSS
ncbi:unnamed protein product [Adineta steineri]|uniref:N-acetyltransferase domain-containing protein n=1 Tax=Adineta steineri TaxID=433720 RepID=A0A813Q1Q7_9BILA|nr:unnamed protein product [Adineta steineri]CAF0761018.1 unnamed protein product [Adineta steineri]CAF0765665.1 unnamed protein product [Adineta steineri]CAF3599643.1 unnamed protein product [Adineta steineri]CAF3907708.1 unnamed protein product [Adineta steineri]